MDGIQTLKPNTIRTILFIWIGWVILVLGFQAVAAVRLRLQSPDTVLNWTAAETEPGAHDKQPYLLDPFLNQQVAYDSEFYLSIATAGYDDPAVRAVWLDPKAKPYLIWGSNPLPYGIPNDYGGGSPFGIPGSWKPYSLNYAFFPFYPLMIRVFSFPLGFFGMNTIATATLSGIIVSLLGALGGMLALYELTRDELKETGAMRAAFYLIVFPTGFFLAMVHTEGLFIGLAFGALAMLKRKRWLAASLLAACATVTRAVGGALVIPLAIAWLTEASPYLQSWLNKGRRQIESAGKPRWDLLWKGALALSPIFAYGLWNVLLGGQFRTVETAFFGRGALEIGKSMNGWVNAYQSLFASRSQVLAKGIGWGMIAFTVLMAIRILVREWMDKKMPGILSRAANFLLAAFGAALVFLWIRNTDNAQSSVYYLLEFSTTILALMAVAYTLRSAPGLSLFSLAVVVISFFSGSPQGMPRYILGAPAVFVMLGHFGHKNDAFDRIWTVGSVLGMGLLALLFAFNFWVG